MRSKYLPASLSAVIAAALALCLPASALAEGKLPNIPGHDIGKYTDTRVLAYGRAQKEKRPSLAKLDADCAALDKDLAALAARLKDWRTALGDAETALALPGKLVAKMDKLDKAMTAVLDGLKIAKLVPQCKDTATTIETAISPVEKELKSLRDTVDKVAQKAETPRKAAEKAGSGAEKARAGVAGLDESVVQREPAATTAVQYSIYYLADVDPGVANCMQGKVDDIAPALDKLAVELDRVVKLALTSYSLDIPDFKLLKKFSVDLGLLWKLEKELDKLESALSSIEGPLGDLEDLFDSGIKFHVDLGVDDFTIKLSMKTITKGAQAIEDAIEDYLSDALWEAAKLFGLNKVVSYIENEANKALDKVTSKLRWNLALTLPGEKELAALAAAIGDLAASLQRLSFPAVDLGAPDLGLPFVSPSIDLSKFKPGLAAFAPLGKLDYDWPALHDHWPTLGCK